MSGRAKRLSLDRYVWLATRGLPKRVRLDTAAELRVHLLERIRALEGQGFPRSEAEHVAVSEMGLPDGTNRAFLRHFFTYKTGWVVLGLAALSAGVWWGKDNLFAKPPSVEKIVLGTPELSSILTSESLREMTTYQAFRIILPQGAVGLEWSLIKDGILEGSIYSYLPQEEALKYNLAIPNNYRAEYTLISGFRRESKTCQTQSDLGVILIEKSIWNGSTGSTSANLCFAPKDGYGADSSLTSSQTGELVLNTWQVVWSVGLGPDQSNCFNIASSRNGRDCSTRSKLQEDMQTRPAKHWDRYAFVAVRAFDRNPLEIVRICTRSTF